MALITTYLDFGKHPIKVPNAGTSSTTNPEATSLNGCIEKCEPEFLKKLWGYELYKSFIAGIDNEEADYLAIKNGAEYEDVNGRLQKWEGFKVGHNPIANYTYCQFLIEKEDTLTGIGVKSLNGENAKDTSGIDKDVVVWNEMVKMNFQLHDYLVANRDKYPSYIGLVYDAYYYYPHCVQENQTLFIAKNTWGI